MRTTRVRWAVAAIWLTSASVGAGCGGGGGDDGDADVAGEATDGDTGGTDADAEADVDAGDGIDGEEVGDVEETGEEMTDGTEIPDGEEAVDGEDVPDATDGTDGTDTVEVVETDADPDADAPTEADGAADADDDGGSDAAEAEVVACEDPFLNGGFTSTASWTATGRAVIAPAAAGHAGSGEAQIPALAVCALNEISQIVTLPPMAACGPARLVHWVKGDGFGMGTSLADDLNGNWLLFDEPVLSTWLEVSRCLGEAAWEPDARFGFGAAFRPNQCDTAPAFTPGLLVDDVALVFDATCPEVGEVTNGDLEAGDGSGWTTAAVSTAAAEADVAGVGVGGSYGARLSCAAGCTEATLSVPASIPLLRTLANPALSFQARLTSGETADVRVEGLPQLRLRGSGTFREVRVCLPRFVAGAVHEVSFHAAYWGACGAPMGPVELVVDDVRVLDDPACDFASGMLDPGLESSRTDPGRYGWVVSAEAGSWGGAPVAEVRDDAAAAFAGRGVGHLVVDQRCDSAALAQATAVPAPSATAGPAVVLHYRYPAPSISVLRFWVAAFHEPGRVLVERTVLGAAAWTREVLCLPPVMAGRPATLNVGLSSFGLCAEFFPVAEDAWVAGFEVTTDPSCPTS
jgi:hypothetical protein